MSQASPEPEAMAYEVPALVRADAIMACLSASASPLDAGELLARTGIPRSTLYLLLDTMERRRWVERLQGGYMIGVRMLELGGAFLAQDILLSAFRSEAGHFVAAHNEVVQLAMLDGAQVVFLARLDAQRPVRLVSDVGVRLPANSCALGKALLASLDDAAVRERMDGRMGALTTRSIVDLDVLLAELAEVRVQGLACDREEVLAGLHCFAVYVGEATLERRVAISTSLPSDRLEPGHVRQVQESLRRLARKVAVRMARAG